jgi:hypothetical protein
MYKRVPSFPQSHHTTSKNTEPKEQHPALRVQTVVIMIFGNIVFLLTGITATAVIAQEATPADRVILAQYDVLDKLYLEPHSDAKRRSEGNVTGIITV